MPRIFLALVAAGVCYYATLTTASAQTVWSGFDVNFEKGSFADPTAPANQDRITDNVWITRKVNEGIFNAKAETTYALISPADTEWATDLNNSGNTIVATNFAALDFDPWIDAYGGQGSQQLPSILTSRNAVVHLITDDIYLDLRFTSWMQGGGGAFSYTRAAAPVGPEITGDYNEDGFVDAADYVMWRKDTTFGSYIDWRTHFGQSFDGGGDIAAAVPEPCTFVLVPPAAWLAVWSWKFRKRTQQVCDARIR